MKLRESSVGNVLIACIRQGLLSATLIIITILSFIIPLLSLPSKASAAPLIPPISNVTVCVNRNGGSALYATVTAGGVTKYTSGGCAYFQFFSGRQITIEVDADGYYSQWRYPTLTEGTSSFVFYLNPIYVAPTPTPILYGTVHTCVLSNSSGNAITSASVQLSGYSSTSVNSTGCHDYTVYRYQTVSVNAYASGYFSNSGSVYVNGSYQYLTIYLNKIPAPKPTTKPTAVPTKKPTPTPTKSLPCSLIDAFCPSPTAKPSPTKALPVPSKKTPTPTLKAPKLPGAAPKSISGHVSVLSTNDAESSYTGGTTITVVNANTGSTATRTTDGSGNYSFSGLASGTQTYQISVSVPARYVSASSTSTTRTLNNGDNVTIDFAFKSPPAPTPTTPIHRPTAPTPTKSVTCSLFGVLCPTSTPKPSTKPNPTPTKKTPTPTIKFPTFPTASPTPIAKVTIRGKVVDANGNVLEGATVRLMRNGASLYVGNDTTDQNGAYGFLPVAQGTYILSSSLTGYVHVENTYILQMNAANITLTMNKLGVQNPTPAPAKTNVRGKVTDTSGNPLGGVSISVTQDGIARGGGNTLPDGTYEFPPLEQGVYTFKFSKSGFISVEKRYYLQVSSAIINISLANANRNPASISPTRPPLGKVTQPPLGKASPTPTPVMTQLRGKVIDSNGNPLEGVTITLMQNSVSRGDGKTLPDGSYSFPPLEYGIYTARFTKKNYIPFEQRYNLMVNTAIVNVTLTSLGLSTPTLAPAKVTIRGKVTDKSNNTPLSGVSISITQNGVSRGGGVTISNGTYEFPPIEQGSYTLKFTKAGYFPIEKTYILSFTTVAINEAMASMPELGKITNTPTPVPQKVKLTIHATTGTGFDAPVANAQISACPLPPITPANCFTGATGNDGNIALLVIAPGSYNIYGTRSDLGLTGSSSITLGTTSQSLTLTLKKSQSGIINGTVYLEDENGNQSKYTSQDIVVTLTGTNNIHQVTNTNNQGFYSFNELTTPGDYTVAITPPSTYDVTSTNPTTGVNPPLGSINNAQFSIVNFRIKRHATSTPKTSPTPTTTVANYSVQGLIYEQDASGNNHLYPGTSLEIRAYNAIGESKKAVINGDGTFVINPLGKINYVIKLMPTTGLVVLSSPEVSVSFSPTNPIQNVSFVIQQNTTAPSPTSQQIPQNPTIVTGGPQTPSDTTAPTTGPTEPVYNPDFNNDGVINNLDYTVFSCEFLGNGTCTTTGSQKKSDVNGDGIVNLIDFIIWRNVRK